MPAEFFLDTNVLVYTFDQTDPEKQKKARELVEHASDGILINRNDGPFVVANADELVGTVEAAANTAELFTTSRRKMLNAQYRASNAVST